MKLETNTVIEKYKDSIFKASFNICKNVEDAEDITQDTFILYHTEEIEFNDEQHIKAWLLRVAINKSKNVVRSFWKTKGIPLDEFAETLSFENPDIESLFDEVMKLPEKYRIVIHLFYYEDYTVKEISEIISASESNVKVRLNRGRKILKSKLKEQWLDD